jgi:hypothetical protein
MVNSVSVKGSRRVFPRYRSTVLDIIRVSQSIPSFPLVRTMQLAELSRVRRACPVRIAWPALFAKAYGIVCLQLPELRELFVRLPRKLMYLHPHSVASISVHRHDDEGNQRLIFGRWNAPESTPLAVLQERLDAFSNAPIEEVFGEGLWLERKPALFRRFIWWWVTNWTGRQRAKRIGTFSISSVGGHGALNAHHPLITTSSLAFGPIGASGFCEVVLICDHRTLDGVLGARALEMLESTLNSQILNELSSVTPLAALDAA